MQFLDETKLNSRENLVLQKYSERPWRPEALSDELKKKMSRPTFYRAHRLLSDNFNKKNKPARRLSSPLIYVISDEEKRQFGLVDNHGGALKGTYYFRKDERKSQRWSKVLQKIRNYDRKNSPYYLLELIQRDFSEYPLVLPEDVIKIAGFQRKIPEGDFYNCERKLFKFLEPQIRRLKPLLNEDETRRVSIAVRAIFESCTKDLLGASQTNVNEYSKTGFDILCRVYTEEEARKLVESLFARKVDAGKEQADIRARLISDIAKVFAEHFDKAWIVTFLNSKIRELDDREIEFSIEDPKEAGNVVSLRSNLTETLKELNSS